MRAAGMGRAAREAFAQGSVDLPLDKLLHGNPVIAALGAS
jgi:hypothetical protein